jgi:hypothetical protein
MGAKIGLDKTGKLNVRLVGDALKFKRRDIQIRTILEDNELSIRNVLQVS